MWSKEFKEAAIAVSEGKGHAKQMNTFLAGKKLSAEQKTALMQGFSNPRSTSIAVSESTDYWS